ncbi:MAG: DUF4830 domain-containing protein [Eubacteriales bacterium]|nr:DUF4830 domain-containing protein [Eubacteriales bacterium]
MMVMTAKVNLKKVLLALAAVAALILALIALLGGNESTQTSAPTLSSNDARVKFLTDLGWEVTTSPTESSQVKIPSESSPVFERYNNLQKSQGYDLSKYAGKKVMRYVYKINNYPGATEPVYATLLIYKNEIIGGDVTDSAPNGQIRGFKMPQTTVKSTTPSVSTTPTESSLPDTAR